MEPTDKIKKHPELDTAPEKLYGAVDSNNAFIGEGMESDESLAAFLNPLNIDVSIPPAPIAAVQADAQFYRLDLTDPLEPHEPELALFNEFGRLADNSTRDHAGAPSFQTHLPAAMAMGQSERVSSTSSIPPPPLGRYKIGRYEVIYPMAAGGMASVHLGRLSGLAGFERLVAIKIIHPHLSNRQMFVDMFLDEARLAAQLHHPNIGEVIEVGEDDGLLYMVGELIIGRNLRDLFNRARKKGVIISQPLIAYIMSRVCRGLHAAHELAGTDGEPLHLVHRDVSPRNIMISYAGDVKLIDFGIVHAEGRLSHTEVGLLKGKFGFVSPEQGRGETLDRRSDIFSVGVTLYLLITGSLPFESHNEHRRIIKLQKGEFPPPSRLNPKTAPDLERIILKAMQTRPQDRYQTAAELAYDLEGFLSHEDRGDYVQELSGLMRQFFAEELKSHKQKLRRHRREMGEVSTRIDLNNGFSSRHAAYDDSGLQTPSDYGRDETGEQTKVERPPVEAVETQDLMRPSSSWGINGKTIIAPLGALRSREWVVRRRGILLVLSAAVIMGIGLWLVLSSWASENVLSRRVEQETDAETALHPVDRATLGASLQKRRLTDSSKAYPVVSPRMTLTLETSVVDYAVMVDDVLIGKNVNTLKLLKDNRQHRLTVFKEGARSFQAFFTANGDSHIEVILEPEELRESPLVKALKRSVLPVKQKPPEAPKLQDSPYK
ncbi:MAG: serine/threonine protein kinase [Deltaproteobacteria bacterium]|nr:serine/threonine protein kinase [Deltaproteobacteria bacterium]